MSFSYKIVRSRRRSLAVEIRSGELIVRAPRLVPVFVIDRFVKSKADWIKHKLKISARQILPKTIDRVAAREKINAIAERLIAKYKVEFNLGTPKITYKLYRSKWGSCSAKNDLSFNLALAEFSNEVIEYVVLHELAHTKVKNHSKRFWQELEKYLPDYKLSRATLRKSHTHHYL